MGRGETTLWIAPPARLSLPQPHTELKRRGPSWARGKTALHFNSTEETEMRNLTIAILMVALGVVLGGCAGAPQPYLNVNLASTDAAAGATVEAHYNHEWWASFGNDARREEVLRNAGTREAQIWCDRFDKEAQLVSYSVVTRARPATGDGIFVPVTPGVPGQMRGIFACEGADRVTVDS